MTHINRHNYKAILTEFSEGMLSETEANELMFFLEENGDLLNEFLLEEDAETPIISPERVVFNEKELLKKVVFQDEVFDEVSWLSIARLEGDATPAELLRLSEIMEKSSAVSKDAALFENVKLTPPNVSFYNKDSLKRFFVEKRPYVRWYYAAAVAVVLVIITFPFWHSPKAPSTLALDAPSVKQNLAARLASKTSGATFVPERELAGKAQIGQNEKSNPTFSVTKATVTSVLPANEDSEVKPINTIAEVSSILPRIVVVNPALASSQQVDGMKKATITLPLSAEYLSVSEYLTAKISNAAGLESKKFKRVSAKTRAWEYAQLSISSIANFIGIPVKVDKQYDQDGNLKKISIDTKLLALSKTF